MASKKSRVIGFSLPAFEAEAIEALARKNGGLSKIMRKIIINYAPIEFPCKHKDPIKEMKICPTCALFTCKQIEDINQSLGDDNEQELFPLFKS